MITDKEMAKYRSKIISKRDKRGRRKSDAPHPPFLSIGWMIELALLMLAGVGLLFARATK